MKFTFTTLFLLLFCFINTSFSQVTDEDVKKYIIKTLIQQSKDLAVLGDPESSSDKVKAAKSKVMKTFEAPDVFVVNDVDSVSSRPDFFTVDQYINNYRAISGLGLKCKYYTNKGTGLGVYVDKERNALTYKYTVRRVNLYTTTIERSVDSVAIDTVFHTSSDSILKIDSVITPIVSIDTIKVTKSRYLDIYFHMDQKDGKYQDIKIAAIALKKKQPKYKELDKLTAWWASLDEKWQKLVSDELNFPKVPSPYYLEMVQGIQRLDFADAQMDTWEPLLEFKGVKQLKLKGSNIDNLSYLKNMSRLSAVNLNNTKLTSLDGLNAQSLEFLFAADLGLDNIDALTGSKYLIEADLSGNNIESLEPLKANTKLEELYINANKITDLTPLSRLTALEKLHCGKNKEISSLAPLRGMYNLVELDVFNTNVATLKDIVGLKKITRLDISYTKINSLLPMRHLKYLTYLAFSGNNLDNYGVLDGFAYLKTLKCASTNISDMGPVNRMDRLLTLYAPHTEFSKNDIQRFKKNHPKCAITYY